jgi:hypothetical protein
MTLNLSRSSTSRSVISQNLHGGKTYFRRVALSASFARAKLSKPEQTLTRRLLEKNPPSVIPTSRKPFALKRALGLGLRSFLKGLNTALGIDPLDDGAGGG